MAENVAAITSEASARSSDYEAYGRPITIGPNAYTDMIIMSALRAENAELRRRLGLTPDEPVTAAPTEGTDDGR